MLLLAAPSGRGEESGGFSSIPVSLDPAGQNSFWIDRNEAVTVTLPAERRDLRLVFRNPKGLVWELAAPASEAADSPPETVYGITIEDPLPGAWTLSVSSSNPLPENPGARLRISYTNRVRPRMVIPRRTFVVGEALPVSLELMDGSVRVKELLTAATLSRLEAPAVVTLPWGFHDDGLHGDRIAKDGLYTAMLPTNAPGRFQLEVQMEGLASSGHCHRTLGLTFRVVPKAARITGNLSHRLQIGVPE